MTVSFVAEAEANELLTTSTSTCSFVVPASSAVDDTAIVFVVQNTGTAGFTAPSGWLSLSGPDDNNANLRTQIWAKDLVTGEPGATKAFTSSIGSRFIGLMSVYRGTSASQIFKTFVANETASTSITSPSIVTTVDGTEVCMFSALRVAAGVTSGTTPTYTIPGSHSLDGQVSTLFSTSPNYSLIGSHRTTAPVAGTYGGSTVTVTSSVTSNIYSLALPPKTTIPEGIRHYIVKGGAEVPITFDLA